MVGDRRCAVIYKQKDYNETTSTVLKDQQRIYNTLEVPEIPGEIRCIAYEKRQIVL